MDRFTTEKTRAGTEYTVCHECGCVLLPLGGKLRGKERTTHVRVCPGQVPDNNQAA